VYKVGSVYFNKMAQWLHTGRKMERLVVVLLTLITLTHTVSNFLIQYVPASYSLGFRLTVEALL